MISTTAEGPPVILLTHQDPIIRLGLDLALQRASFDGFIQCATPGSEDYAKSLSNASVVVTDYDQGVEICRQARRISWGHVPQWPRILVVSHRQGEHDIRTAISAGVMGYLFFGFELSEFIGAVDSLLKNTRYFTSFAVQKMAESMMYEELTPRELEVLSCLVGGRVNKQICEELDIALGTVKSHVKAIFSKFGVVTRTQAVRVAYQRGLTTTSDDSRQQKLSPCIRLSEARMLHG